MKSYQHSVTAKSNMIVSYECENCGESNSHTIELISVYNELSYFGEKASDEMMTRWRLKAVEMLEEEKQKKIKYKAFGIEKCPHCGYMQSWMIGNNKLSWQVLASLATFILLCFIAGLRIYNMPNIPTNQTSDVLLSIGIPLLVSVIMFFIVGSLVSKPNRKYKNVTKVNEPRISWSN